MAGTGHQLRRHVDTVRLMLCYCLPTPQSRVALSCEILPTVRRIRRCALNPAFDAMQPIVNTTMRCRRRAHPSIGPEPRSCCGAVVLDLAEVFTSARPPASDVLLADRAVGCRPVGWVQIATLRQAGKSRQGIEVLGKPESLLRPRSPTLRVPRRATP